MRDCKQCACHCTPLACHLSTHPRIPQCVHCFSNSDSDAVMKPIPLPGMSTCPFRPIGASRATHALINLSTQPRSFAPPQYAAACAAVHAGPQAVQARPARVAAAQVLLRRRLPGLGNPHRAPLPLPPGLELQLFNNYAVAFRGLGRASATTPAAPPPGGPRGWAAPPAGCGRSRTAPTEGGPRRRACGGRSSPAKRQRGWGKRQRSGKPWRG